ncbi:GNAT family N-acetyltransferase [Streptomyces sp. SR27]|uniref:GNAT family N-acetyltransferase n=1 Tax=Streptomyces sp. SR27 TaxID=3076630 RepID=UPI003FA385AE
MNGNLRFYRHGDLPESFRQLLIDVHANAYADQMDDPFHQRFWWFVDHWSAMEGFSCVVAFEADEPVGFAYGAPLQEGREWWRSTSYEPNNGHTSTFAVSEVMVRPAWRKQGYSSSLHEALLQEREEDLAVLLVDIEHPKVQALYEAWDYTKVGERRPFADSPLYAVMLRELRP